MLPSNKFSNDLIITFTYKVQNMTNLNNTTTLISFKTGVISEYKGTTWLNQLHKNIEADKIFKQPEIKYPHIEYHKTI